MAIFLLSLLLTIIIILNNTSFYIYKQVANRHRAAILRSGRGGGDTYVFKEQLFPYQIEDGQHYVLWYVLMLIELCHGYHIEGSYRVVHWRANASLLLLYSTVSLL